MKTNFLSLNDKINLLKNPDQNTVQYLLDELNRLEAVIRDFEIGVDMLNAKLNTSQFKYPIDINNPRYNTII